MWPSGPSMRTLQNSCIIPLYGVLTMALICNILL